MKEGRKVHHIQHAILKYKLHPGLGKNESPLLQWRDCSMELKLPSYSYTVMKFSIRDVERSLLSPEYCCLSLEYFPKKCFSFFLVWN